VSLSVNSVTGRRALQVALGMVWLLDGLLQFQPYMFTKAFVSQVIGGSAAGAPVVVADPITWSAGDLLHHTALYNTLFASIQLSIGLGLLWPRTAKAALAASIPWAIGVWWIGEGLGGLLSGTASTFTGAPGAAILYVFVALLAWPHRESADPGSSVATTGRLGGAAPRVIWAVLWVTLGYFALRPASGSPDGLAAMFAGMKAGEPQWIAAIDGALATTCAHLGIQVAVIVAVLSGIAAATVALGRFSRLGVIAAAAIGAAIWLAEDFGAVFTGQGTDPNSGLLLLLVAAAFWPVAAQPRAASLG